MNREEYLPRLVLGLAILVLALSAAWSFGRGRGPVEESIVEELVERIEPEREPRRVSWDLNVIPHERIVYWIDYLKCRNYDRTRLWLERSVCYEDLIREQLRVCWMPDVLIYLVLI